MVNLLGDENATGQASYFGMEKLLSMKGVYPHLYGKEMVKPFRKMGHITIINQSLEEAKKTAREIKSLTKVTAE